MKNFKNPVVLYEELTKRGLFTEAELSLALALMGTSVETLEECLYVRYGYRDLSQLIEEEEE